MPMKIVRFSTQLTDVQTPFGLSVPLDGQDLALRVYCRYLPETTPPPPTVSIVVGVQDPPVAVAEDGTTKQTLRTFMLWPVGADLPANFVKYIGSVPFGTDKIGYDIIEVGA